MVILEKMFFYVFIKVRKWFRDHRQINLIMLDGFCPLSKFPSRPCSSWTISIWMEYQTNSNENYLPFLHCTSSFNPIQDGSSWGCSRMGRGKKTLPLSKIGHTYPALMKLSTVIPYLKKIQKYINHATHPLSSADISIFPAKISNF